MNLKQKAMGAIVFGYILILIIGVAAGTMALKGNYLLAAVDLFCGAWVAYKIKQLKKEFP
jgi:hypothetical protein